MQTEIMNVNGMTGEACADKVSAALLAINGVNDVTVSLAVSKATVKFDEELTSQQELQATLARAGYGIEVAPVAKKAGGCCGGCGGGGHC